jgi:hypothetical protein
VKKLYHITSLPYSQKLHCRWVIGEGGCADGGVREVEGAVPLTHIALTTVWRRRALYSGGEVLNIWNCHD